MARSSCPAKVRLWQARFRQHRDSQLTIAQFCHFIGCSVASFYYWRQRLETVATNPATPSLTPKSKIAPSTPTQSSFLPVVVVGRTVERVSIKLGNGTMIRIPCAAIEAIHAVLKHSQRVA
jgi:hypothetical protein